MIPKAIANKFFFGRWVTKRMTPIKMMIVNKIIKISNPLNVVVFAVSCAASSNIAKPPLEIHEITTLLLCYLPSGSDARGKTSFCQTFR
ncbi:hypothetical protein D3C74_288540 [compost metagenome]